jgi:hypothetical protein
MSPAALTSFLRQNSTQAVREFLKIYEGTPIKLKQAHFCIFTSYNYAGEAVSRVPHTLRLCSFSFSLHIHALYYEYGPFIRGQ